MTTARPRGQTACGRSFGSIQHTFVNGAGALNGAQGAGADVFVANGADSWWTVHLLVRVVFP